MWLKTNNFFYFLPGLLLLPNIWKCTMLKRRLGMVKVCSTSKWTRSKLGNHYFTGPQRWLLSPASPETISLQQALHESVFSPGISVSPPHRVALCWDKHCQLLPEVLGLTAKRVAAWSAEEVWHATESHCSKLWNTHILVIQESGPQFFWGGIRSALISLVYSPLSLLFP